MEDLDVRAVQRRRDAVVHKSACQQVPLLVVCELLEQGTPDGVYHSSVQLPFDYLLVDHRPTILDHDVPQYLDRS